MKKVLVTGGTQGVGLETAKLLLEQGYEVHITYRRSAGKAEELMAANPGRLFAHKLDQGKIEEIENADFLVENEWYGVIFNAALGSGTVKEYADQGDPLKAANDMALMTVNALGPLWIYKKMEPMLQAKKRLIQPSEIAFWLGELLRDESTLFHGANIDATMGLGTRPGIQTEAGLEHN